VSDPVRALFEYYLQRAITTPVLIEWGNAIPELDVPLDEAQELER